ncbi:hypothetical protein CEXT_213921 [Caerostris extrusa]|uniref:Uncharacterized protein n=1 Tax=Caerostris extrusa TaxID=172846 RepID=A0AAV4MTL2_CAEEX|nr:hypothetical protein CEXT_213921 [Caerostris extrusa]
MYFYVLNADICKGLSRNPPSCCSSIVLLGWEHEGPGGHRHAIVLTDTDFRTGFRSRSFHESRDRLPPRHVTPSGSLSVLGLECRGLSL